MEHSSVPLHFGRHANVAWLQVFWVYHTQLTLPKNLFDPRFVETNSTLETGPGILAKVFILGEEYQMPELMNDVMDAFILWATKGGRIPGKVISHAFENSEKASNLSHFLVDFAEISCKDESPEYFAKMRDDLPREFLLQLTESLCGWLRFFKRDKYLELSLSDLKKHYCDRFHRHLGTYKKCTEVKEYNLISEYEE